MTILDLLPFELPVGEYIVTIETSNICGASQDTTGLTINGFPDSEIDAADSLTACLGENILLSANSGDGLTYHWQLDSIDIPNANQQTYVATDSGSYTVTITRNACSKKSNELNLQFVHPPNPTISTEDVTSICDGKGVNVAFKVNHEADVAYQWFKDGSPISGEMDTTFTAVERGEYKLEASSSLCKVISNSIEITDSPTIIPDFDVSSKACLGTSVFFKNTTPASPGTNLVYTWNFGDASPEENGMDATHIFDSLGFFDVKLTAAEDEDCKNNVSHQIEIVPPIEIDFEKLISPANLCGPILVDFMNQSVGSDLNFNWDFGNGETSTLENPTQINFLQRNIGDTSYVVTLNVQSDVSSCPTNMLKDTITVSSSPIAQFLFATDGICAEQLIPINNFSLGLTDTFIWDFGDGTSSLTTNTIGTIEHAFPYNGSNDTTYQVTLTAINECGSSELTRPFVVTASNVEAFFNVDKTSGCSPLDVNFTSNQNGFNTITWNWGDTLGNTSTGGITRNYTYLNPGEYNVELLIQNGCNSDSYRQVVTVLPIPVVEFESNIGTCVGKEVTFTNTSPEPVGSVWDFDNGDPFFVGAIPPSQLYDLTGFYDVTLTIADPVSGCSNSSTKTVEISPVPVANFSSVESICAGSQADIQNNSSDASSYTWRFWEGGPLDIGNVAQTPVYNYPGKHTITLYAKNDFNCIDSINQMIDVYANAEPEFDFILINHKSESPLEVEIKNRTAFPLSSEGTFNWVLPDGITENNFDVSENLLLINNSEVIQQQTVQLTATTDLGCTASIEKSIPVYPYIPCEDKLKIPNVFSPNGDGLNDELRPLILDSLSIYKLVTTNDVLENYRMEVYSRWGELIFQSENVEEGWTGNGHAEGIYLVVISFKCLFIDNGKFKPKEVLLKH